MTNPKKIYSVEDLAHPAAETIARRKELKALTGCSHTYVIEGRCSEPGCANSLIVAGKDDADPFLADIPQPIINTKTRKWCVL